MNNGNTDGSYMNQLLDDLLLGKFLKENNIREIKDRQLQEVNSQGDYYLSVIWKEMIKVITMNGKIRKRNFIVKAAHGGPLAKQYTEKEGIFKKECQMYTEVLPLMAEQIENCEGGGELLWPKLVAARPYDLIILEDLTFNGYKKVDRHVGLDYEHALLTFKGIAKFHVLSLAIKDKFQGSNSLLANYTFANDTSRRIEFFKRKIQNLSQMMLNNWEEKWHKLAIFLSDHSEELFSKHVNLCKFDVHNFNVINHGDLWISNLLFKYCEFTDKLIGVRFVDFQMSHFGSFAVDLQYILQTTVQPEVRKNFTQELLTAYHETLVATARKICTLSADIVIPSLCHIIGEVHAKRLTGICLTVYLLDLMLVNPCEAVDIESLLKLDNENSLRSMNNNELYTNRMQAILEPYISGESMENLLSGKNTN